MNLLLLLLMTGKPVLYTVLFCDSVQQYGVLTSLLVLLIKMKVINLYHYCAN